MRGIVLAVLVFFGVFSAAEARPRGARHVQQVASCLFMCGDVANYASVQPAQRVRAAPRERRHIRGYDRPARAVAYAEARERRAVRRHAVQRGIRIARATRSAPVVTYQKVPEPIHTAGVGARPHAWCGWWMQIKTGITSASTKLNLNRAIEWKLVGSPAPGPVVGAIMVEPHHVSLITKVLGNGRVVAISGNDGRAVRERERTTRRAVAYRVV